MANINSRIAALKVYNQMSCNDSQLSKNLKKVASVFNISMTDLVKEAINEHVAKLKKDPFYRLTANVEDASEEETEEILEEIESMTDDDLSIVSVKHVAV